jgi:hypothetical protein
MTKAEADALARIALSTDPEALRNMAANARGKSEAVERAANRRLASVSAQHEPGTVEHACWSMVHAIEELRRVNGRKVSRMNRLRPKIEKDGEVAALAYCVLNETDGFAEVMQYGTPELAAEAIALSHPTHFSEAVLATARARLEREGVSIDANGRIDGRGESPQS